MCPLRCRSAPCCKRWVGSGRVDGEGVEGGGDMGLGQSASSRTRVAGGRGTCSTGLLAATVAVTEVWLLAVVLLSAAAVYNSTFCVLWKLGQALNLEQVSSALIPAYKNIPEVEQKY